MVSPTVLGTAGIDENGKMRRYRPLLNPTQIAVLGWVGDGCPEGVHSDWSHRVTARTLHNRDLITIKGQGKTWTATLTKDGSYYLSHGEYPSGTPKSHESATLTVAPVPPSPSTRRSPTAKKPGPMDQMMTSLKEAEGHRITIPRDQESRYRQLATAAKRFGRIPEKMRITIGWAEDGRRTVTLEPLPAWQTRVLKPLKVPRRLTEPSDVITTLSESETFQVSGKPRQRALRLLEVLVTTARSRDMKVTARTGRPLNSTYVYRDSPRHDELEFSLGRDKFRVWFAQATLQKPHEPTRRELARVQYGYLFPDFDDVPSEHLSIVLDGEGGKFWANEWHDTDDHRLEDDLAQVLEEIRLRHEHQEEKRHEEQERRIAAQRREEENRTQAVVNYRKKFLTDAMESQAKRWENADRLHRYAQAVRRQAEHLKGEEQQAALHWAEQISAHATRTDPLPQALVPPEVPDPSYADLDPFMKPYSS